jgi:hypothetical protein
MENNLNLKSYQFNNKTDFIYYLSEMMIDLIQRKEKIESYLKEIDCLLNSNSKFIDSNLYESISDSLARPLEYIFNLLGDESKKAVSYRKFRKILFKKKDILDIKLDKLNQDEESILGQFNQLRNWSLHIPESIYIEKKSFFKMDTNFINENKNKIIIPKYENFEIKFLENFKKEIDEVLSEIDKILSRMKDDYRILIGEDFEIEYEKNYYKPFVIMDIVSNSWDIQNGKKK